MKAKLKNRQIIPNGGGFRIKDRQTGLNAFGLNFNYLVTKFAEQRRINGIPMGLEFEDEVEDWCCQEYPQECEDVDPDSPKRRTLTLSDVIHGTQVMVAFKMSGSKLVDRAEAERRGAICKTCPFNQSFAKPCSGVCAELAAVVTSITGHQGTHYDQFLNACSICGCFLQAAIWLPLETQCVAVTDQMKKQFANVSGCWKQCT